MLQTVLVRTHKASFLLQIPINGLLLMSLLFKVILLNLVRVSDCCIRARAVSERIIIE